MKGCEGVGHGGLYGGYRVCRVMGVVGYGGL